MSFELLTFPRREMVKHSCTFHHLYVFYVCATFNCIWTSGFEVICTLASALKSKMATDSTEMKWVDWKINKPIFQLAPLLKIGHYRYFPIRLLWRLCNIQPYAPEMWQLRGLTAPRRVGYSEACRQWQAQIPWDSQGAAALCGCIGIVPAVVHCNL